MASGLVAACGKRGPPLAPLLRIPAAPPDLTVTRVDEEVFAQFKVPAVNQDGIGPADVARVELYAITAEEPPLVKDPEDLRKLSTLVGTEPVRRPLLPPPPAKEGAPPVPLPPPGPGVDQGAVVVIRERLTAENRTPVALPASDEARDRGDAPPQVPRPLVAPLEVGGPVRYYYAVAVNARGRYGAHSGLVPAPLGPTSSAPTRPEIAVDESSMTIRWTAAADTRGVAVEPTPPDLLPSRSLVPAPEPTMYDVYQVSPDKPADQPAVPVPLTQAPVGTHEFTQSPITLGTERCFVVRPVDIVSGIHVRGPASEPVCASFADTFAPPSPSRLEAVATSGMITLIWEPVEASDVAGYLVLRGEVGSATLTPLTTEPVVAPTYRDNSVGAGTRFVYAIIAIDKSGNRSAESNRVEETARQ